MGNDEGMVKREGREKRGDDRSGRMEGVLGMEWIGSIG
jgi:hypothetical protein